MALEDYAIDFNVILGHLTERSVAYVVCYLRSEAEQSDLRMLVGSDDVAKVYLNGMQIHKHHFSRLSVANQDKVQDFGMVFDFRRA